jgi:uncharacterized protein YPO0396
MTEELDLTLLLEQHKKEKWEWQKKESQWANDKNILENDKKIIEKLSTQIVGLRKRAQEAEGETTVVKGIGMNSPEMRAALAKIKEAGEINKLHQELNGKLQKRLTEVEEDNKRLSQQVSDYIKKYENSIRGLGL